MGTKIINLKENNLQELPILCRTCLYWEGVQRSEADLSVEEAESLKIAHLKSILSEWGECGVSIIENREPLGYACYGPSKHFPRIKGYRTGPVSDDAIFLACLYISPTSRGKSLGRQLLEKVEKKLYKRNFKAIETFANNTPDEAPSSPVEFYLRNGFFILRDDREFPLMRLDIKAIVPWQESVEAALDSLALPLKRKAVKKALVPL